MIKNKAGTSLGKPLWPKEVKALPIYRYICILSYICISFLVDYVLFI